MNDTISWWRSKTIWGSIIAILAGLVTMAGINIDAPLQSELAELVTALAEIIGGSLAWYGRVKATRKIA